VKGAARDHRSGKEPMDSPQLVEVMVAETLEKSEGWSLTVTS
jgi:hypothetical protein